MNQFPQSEWSWQSFSEVARSTSDLGRRGDASVLSPLIPQSRTSLARQLRAKNGSPGKMKEAASGGGIFDFCADRFSGAAVTLVGAATTVYIIAPVLRRALS